MRNQLIQYNDVWSPFWGLANLQRDVDGLLEDFIRPLSRRSELFSPISEMEETEDHYMVNLDLPGVHREDIQIEAKDGQLFVWGERKQERTSKEGAKHLTEKYYGKFSRVFTLPSAIDSEKIEASFKEGVLRIAVPKAATAKAKRIQIKEEARTIKAA